MDREAYVWHEGLPIAKWKKDGLVESFLGDRADRSELGKKLYVLYYKFTDRRYYTNGRKYIEEAINRFAGGGGKIPDAGKSRKAMVEDMVYSLHRFGASFNDYFWFKFYNLSVEGRMQFVTDKVRHTYMDILNNRENKDIFDNKLKTYNVYKKYYGRDVCCVSSLDDACALKGILDKHRKVLLKPLSANCGKGVKVFESGELRKMGISGILEAYEGGCLVEELLVQDNVLGEVHPGSLNTVRLATVKAGGMVEFFPFIRFGRGESVVDNGGAGGLFAKIDPPTGIIQLAADESGNSYVVHPDTGKQIMGLVVPRWEEAKELAIGLMDVIPDNHSVAWDLALVDDRWVLVEANYCGEFLGQVASGEGDRPRLDKMARLVGKNQRSLMR